MAKTPKKIIEYRVYDLPFELPVLLLDGDEWRISDKLSNRLHFHNCLELGVCHSDSGVLVVENETLPFIAGNVSVIPRHIPHTTCSTKGTKSLWSYVYVDLQDLLNDMRPLQLQPEQELPGAVGGQWLFNKEQHPRIHFLINCILEELRYKKQDWVTVLKGLMLVLEHELMRMQEESLPGERRGSNSFAMKPALDHIHQRYSENISIKELADMCHLSETHFRRMFLTIMGSSPLSFINATRIKHACVRLLTTDESILSIAESVGFASISSFNRSFSQIMGVSPREYRNAASRDSIIPRHKYVLTYKGWMAPEAEPEHTGND